MLFYSNRDAENRHIIPYTKKLINNDIDAYHFNKGYEHIYDKKWVTESQNNKCGFMNEIPIQFPVFIKPIINLKGGNRDCYIINNINEFNKYSNREDLFWSKLYEGEEGSTDFLLDKGKILFELSYKIEKIDGRILGMMTKISTNNKCPFEIIEWVKYNLRDYSGPVNIQYIGENIIEAGLRFDSGGNFIQWTNNKKLIEHINNYIDYGNWIPLHNNDYYFKDRYICGCYKDYPIIYYLPAPLVKRILKFYNVENYNFYIDVDKKGLKYLNIVDTDKEKLIKIKKMIEIIMNSANILIIFLVSLNIILLFLGKLSKILLVFTILIFFSRFINPPKYLRKIM
jgi:hypothetical protein